MKAAGSDHGSIGSDYEEVEVEVETEDDEADLAENAGPEKFGGTGTGADQRASVHVPEVAGTSNSSAAAPTTDDDAGLTPIVHAASANESPASQSEVDAAEAEEPSASAEASAQAQQAPASPPASAEPDNAVAAYPSDFDQIDQAVKSLVGDLHSTLTSAFATAPQASSGPASGGFASLTSSFGALFGAPAGASNVDGAAQASRQVRRHTALQAQALYAPISNVRTCKAVQFNCSRAVWMKHTITRRVCGRAILHLQVAASGAPEDTLTELFKLAKDESLVDTFVCKLQQSYCCSHNSYTPPVQMTYACMLSITDRHVCFAVKEAERVPPFKLPHSAVQSAGLSEELQALLTIRLKDGTSVVLREFVGGDAASNALALVEHLADL